MSTSVDSGAFHTAWVSVPMESTRRYSATQTGCSSQILQGNHGKARLLLSALLHPTLAYINTSHLFWYSIVRLA